jgi:hypothetical protein
MVLENKLNHSPVGMAGYHPVEKTPGSSRTHTSPEAREDDRPIYIWRHSKAPEIPLQILPVISPPFNIRRPPGPQERWLNLILEDYSHIAHGI